MEECGDFISESGKIAEKIRRELLKRGKFAACAESCTGGLVASRLTGVSGASATFAGGLVCYQNSAKIRLLGVSAETISDYSEVSPECALEMSIGALNAFKEADFAVSTTGFIDDNTGLGLEGLSHTAFIGFARRGAEKQSGAEDASLMFETVKVPRVGRLIATEYVAMRALEIMLREVKHA